MGRALAYGTPWGPRFLLAKRGGFGKLKGVGVRIDALTTKGLRLSRTHEERKIVRVRIDALTTKGLRLCDYT